jgi:FAD/FMN-containing dehydrogenase
MAAPPGPPGPPAPPFDEVNDVHSALNATYMRVEHPATAADVRRLIADISATGGHVSVCGGRHAMGGQQFATNQTLIDTRKLNRLLDLDIDRGLARVEAGIQWPALIQSILEVQQRQRPADAPRWGIAQKQTGADNLTIGGSISANVHGRGLLMSPIADDVESFVILTADHQTKLCSRWENPELFSLAIGGYGLFGVIVEVTLRLTRRRTLRRVVKICPIERAMQEAQQHIREGYLYGDFQFEIDPNSPNYLTHGVFSSYCPTDDRREPPPDQRVLSREDWIDLLTLAHSDPSRGFAAYAEHYLKTDGQLYKTDLHQLSEYLGEYHADVDRRTHATCVGSEMITELYVPPVELPGFLRAAAKMLIEQNARVIYGTIRLIQPDPDTVMAWARARSACIIFNLHVDHLPAQIDRAADAFRRLIDLAIAAGGSYYLTYHRFATPEQLERCYPRVREFFARKRAYDPHELFRSDWYCHYAPHFRDERA